MLDLLLLLYCGAVGFVAAGIAASFYKLVKRRAGPVQPVQRHDLRARHQLLVLRAHWSSDRLGPRHSPPEPRTRPAASVIGWDSCRRPVELLPRHRSPATGPDGSRWPCLSRETKALTRRYSPSVGMSASARAISLPGQSQSCRGTGNAHCAPSPHPWRPPLRLTRRDAAPEADISGASRLVA